MPKPVNHILHLILSVLTGGLWLFVYVPLLIRYGRRNKAYVAALNREAAAERKARVEARNTAFAPVYLGGEDNPNRIAVHPID